MAATVVWDYQSDTNLTGVTATGPLYRIVYANPQMSSTTVSVTIASRTVVAKLQDLYLENFGPAANVTIGKPLRRALRVRPFPAPTDLVAGPVRVAMVESQAVPRRPVMQALRGRDRRPLRARPGRRGVLRRQAEQEDEQ